MLKSKLIQYLAIAVPFVVIAVVILSRPEGVSSERKAQLQYEEAERFPAGEDDHTELRAVMDVPGLVNPQLTSAAEADLDGKLEVIGVEFEGESLAFLKDAMADTGPHVVNAVVNERPLSVSYCNLVDCARVLTGEGTKALPLGLGGQDGSMQMVFSYKGNRYSQRSKKIPLQDVTAEEVTLEEWLTLHPNSKIFGREYLVN